MVKISLETTSEYEQAVLINISRIGRIRPNIVFIITFLVVFHLGQRRRVVSTQKVRERDGKGERGAEGGEKNITKLKKRS